MPTLFISCHDGGYHFEMLASDGARVLTSGLYKSASSCIVAVKSLKRYSRYAERFKKIAALNGQFYFVIKDRLENIIATSELFWAASSRDYAIMVVKREAAALTIR